MSDQIQGQIAHVTSLRDANLSHPELGTVGGFERIQETKDGIAQYLLGVLSAIDDADGALDQASLEEILSEIQQFTTKIAAAIDEVNKLAASDIHKQDFPSRRDALLSALQEHGYAFRRTFKPHEALIRAARLERMMNAAEVSNVTREAEARLRMVDHLLSQATKALDNVQTKAMGKAVETAGASFERLRMGHAWREKWWFRGFLLAAFVTLLVIIWVATSSWTAASAPEAIAAVFRRILLISAPALFMRVALAKYNLERNLSIVYDHRDAVLAQYRTFETAIGDDAPAKNQFRLEIAKYIFSDPATGYITQEAGAEINVSPIVGMVERIAGGK